MRKMTGIKKVAGQSSNLKGYYGNIHLQLMYNRNTGKVWADEHTGNSWTQYEDKDIICCGNICSKVTMAEIKNMIAEAIV